MRKPKAPQSGYYAAFTDLVLDPKAKEAKLSDGLVLRRTFAHLMSSNTIAFNPPAEPGKHHGGPWKATTKHEGFDVFTELFIPDTYRPPHGLSFFEVARTITCMLRLYCKPSIRFLLETNYSLSAYASVPDREMVIRPIEVSRNYMELRGTNESVEKVAERLKWVVRNWRSAVELMGSQADFRLAMEAYELASFVPSQGLTLVSLWGALEALFAPSTAELRFRVSTTIASYLFMPGAARLQKQKEIAELYDKRSAAAHGKPKHTDAHLNQSFVILRNVLIRMITAKHVPTKSELNDMVMGVEWAPLWTKPERSSKS
jgi:hypothetical protein